MVNHENCLDLRHIFCEKPFHNIYNIYIYIFMPIYIYIYIYIYICINIYIYVYIIYIYIYIYNICEKLSNITIKYQTLHQTLLSNINS